MSTPLAPPGSRLLRIYVSREQGLRALPGEYEDLEDAKQIFEKHHGEITWCVIAEIEPGTDRPNYLLHGTALGDRFEWKVVG